MDIDKLEDNGFIDWLWSKYQLHLDKIKVQRELQLLYDSVNNGTFKLRPDKELVGIINGHKKVTMIKDSPKRQWALTMKKLHDIESKEKEGFKLKLGER